jgi:broad specificity phosphatase PhoE
LADLDPRSRPPKGLLEATAEAELIISSEKPRAYQSALELCRGKAVLRLEELNEVPLPRIRIPLVQLRAEAWSVLGRLAQAAGYSYEAETIAAALRRSKVVAQRIVQHAATNQKIVVVGHGVINFLIAVNLKGSGWRVRTSGHSSYWRWQLFTE